MENKKNNSSIDENGEFVPAYFAWISLDKQKQIAERLQEMTKNKEKDEN